MNTALLQETMASGGTVFGTMVTSPSAHMAGHMAKAGLDFVFLDTEHVPLEREMLSWMCLAYAGMNLAPIVRIPSPDPIRACQVLDAGAAGVLIPYVEKVEEVEALVGAVKVRPIKGKRLDGFFSGWDEPEEKLSVYVSERNSANLALINIESVPALENIDALLSVNGLDGIVLGPHDLSCSLGIPEEYEHPHFVEAIRLIAGKTREHGLIAGAHFMCDHSVKLARTWMDAGFNMIIQRADVFYAVRGVRADIARLRGQGPTSSVEGINV
jgi:2-keto-3-deoxy-L-rhamnonate aldolase RhmA